MKSIIWLTSAVYATATFGGETIIHAALTSAMTSFGMFTSNTSDFAHGGTIGRVGPKAVRQIDAGTGGTGPRTGSTFTLAWQWPGQQGNPGQIHTWWHTDLIVPNQNPPSPVPAYWAFSPDPGNFCPVNFGGWCYGEFTYDFPLQQAPGWGSSLYYGPFRYHDLIIQSQYFATQCRRNQQGHPSILGPNCPGIGGITVVIPENAVKTDDHAMSTFIDAWQAPNHTVQAIIALSTSFGYNGIAPATSIANLGSTMFPQSGPYTPVILGYVGLTPTIVLPDTTADYQWNGSTPPCAGLFVFSRIDEQVQVADNFVLMEHATCNQQSAITPRLSPLKGAYAVWMTDGSNTVIVPNMMTAGQSVNCIAGTEYLIVSRPGVNPTDACAAGISTAR